MKRNCYDDRRSVPIFRLLCSDYHPLVPQKTWVFFAQKSALKNTHILFVKKLDNIRNFNSLTIGNRARESSPHGAFFEISHCIIYLEGVFLFKCIGLHSAAKRLKPHHIHSKTTPCLNRATIPLCTFKKEENFYVKTILKSGALTT